MFEELEKIELAEELFGTDFPVELTVDLTVDNPRQVVDYFVPRLRGWEPNPVAADLLKKLAKKHNSPRLDEGLHDSWRREQISAVIQEVFSTGDLSAGGDDDALIPVKKPHGPSLAVVLVLRILTNDPSIEGP
jgi:hypothetical protein